MTTPKIHILGGSGSGKTTLAREIATRLNVPHHDLDDLAHKNGPNDAAYIADVAAILAQPGWVTEGIYLVFPDQLLDQADWIVVLDVAWPIAAWRIVRRHVVNTVRGTNQYPGWSLLWKLLRDARGFYLNRRTDTLEGRYFATYGTPREPATAASTLAKLATFSALVIPPSMRFVRQYLVPYGDKVVFIRTKAARKHLLQRLYRHNQATGS